MASTSNVALPFSFLTFPDFQITLQQDIPFSIIFVDKRRILFQGLLWRL